MGELERMRALRNQGTTVTGSAKKILRAKIDLTQIKAGTLSEKLMQSGIMIPAELFYIVVVGIGLSIAAMGAQFGSLLAVSSFLITVVYLFTLFLEERANKRREKVIPHLPGFVDGLASALETGFNLEGAVAQAAMGIPQGVLATELEKVVNTINQGLPADKAILVLKRTINGKEVIALCVAVGIFREVGGRSLEPFRRLAQKIREEQTVLNKAKRDLVQIKQAFNIILALCLLAPAALFVLDPNYITAALSDTFGKIIVQVLITVQLAAILSFRKMIAIRV